MRILTYGIGGVLTLLVFLFAFVATSHAVTVPTECTGMVFDHVIVAEWGQVVNGTSGRDLIIAEGGNIIKAKAGNDCVQSGWGSIIRGEAGNDVLITEGGSVLNGGTGTDTCVSSDPQSSAFVSCE